MNPLPVDGQSVSIDSLVEVARRGRPVVLTDDAVRAVDASQEVVERAVRNNVVVYGVTTGFGKFADRVIPPESLQELQRNLLRSHAVGVGPVAPDDVTRAMLLLRINALALGASGIRMRTLDALIEMLNRGVLPLIPEKGSVGASGDLAPLAHMSLVLLGEGEARFDGRTMTGLEALEAAGLSPITLGPKEGLALINGTQAMTAIGALTLHDAWNLVRCADIIGALSLEAVRGTNTAFDPRIQALRPHPGQVASAANLMRLTEGSRLMSSHRHDTHKIQDPYSLRCMPQVHGASRDALTYASRVVEIEMNSATDNPLVFSEGGDVVSGGNFHGQPVAVAMDAAAIAIAELADISERRIEAMLDPEFSELPPFLTRHAGVDSGYMVSQYTAAALVSENKVLSHPASVDSIPTSANQEDHVSMGTISSRKARSVLENSETVLAVELLCACEGIDFRAPLAPSGTLCAVHNLVRRHVPHLDDDRPMYRDIERVSGLIHDGEVRLAAESVTGALA
ncbi:MAG TPA: histidine ammonia-lyase [Chloroflexota bacterium]|nr:histidine ammonia-lyase [Chloroflexota bacterium]